MGDIGEIQDISDEIAGAAPYISPISPLYLPYISPLYLPYISPGAARLAAAEASRKKKVDRG